MQLHRTRQSKLTPLLVERRRPLALSVRMTQSGETGTLREEDLQPSDARVYTGWSGTGDQTAAWTATLNVISQTNPNVAFSRSPSDPMALPGSPSQPRLLNKSANSLTVGWQSGSTDHILRGHRQSGKLARPFSAQSDFTLVHYSVVSALVARLFWVAADCRNWKKAVNGSRSLWPGSDWNRYGRSTPLSCPFELALTEWCG